jgi:hypothetical protein
MSKRRTSAQPRRPDVDPAPTPRPPSALQCGGIRQALRLFLKRDPHPHDDPAFPTGDDWVAGYRKDGLRSLGFALYDAGLADCFRGGPADTDPANLLGLDLAGAAAILLRRAVGVAKKYRKDPDGAPPRSVEFGPEVREFLVTLARVDPGTLDAFTAAVTARVEAAIAAAGGNTAPTVAPPAGNETAAAKDAKRQQRRRRRQAPRQAHPVTWKQTEALQLVGEHKGNITAAAKQAGKSRVAMSKLYNKALCKLGEKAPKAQKVKTQRLPHDRRGQVAVEGRDEEE